MPENEDPEKKDAAQDEEDTGAGAQPDGVCRRCGMQNDEDAKFCDQCGSTMAAPPLDEGGDEPPPSSNPKPAGAAIKAPKPVSVEGSVASILGASSDSVPAVKKAAIEKRHVFDTAAGVFGTTDHRQIVGALLAVPDKLAAGEKAVKESTKRARDAEKTERMALANRLNALGLAGRPRSSIFVDDVSDDGRRLGVKLQPEYARMDLEVFRSLVASLEKSAPERRANPFEPDRTKAKAAAEERAAAEGISGGPPALVNGEPTKAQIEAAKTAPPVLAQFNSPTNRFKLDTIAEEHVRTCAALGLPIRGAA